MKKLLITCEHGGNQIPSWLLGFLKIPQDLLASHQGWDIGALSIAKAFSPEADAFFYIEISRLCIDLNRSLHHPGLFSEYSKKLDQNLQEKLIQEIYLPYREKIEKQIRSWIDQGHEVMHYSIHSFTPSLNGVTREAEIGFLYDPSRKEEKLFCHAWQKKLKQKKSETNFRVRCNYPYRGAADGFTSFLRKKFKKGYMGLEVEINQKLFSAYSADKLKGLLFL